MATPLRQRFIEDLQVRNYSVRTQEVYVGCVSHFARYFNKSPDHLGPEHIREYQVFLVNEKKCSWAKLNQTVCALRFLYRTTLNKAWVVEHIPFPRKPQLSPAVLSPEEVAAFLGAIENIKYRTYCQLLYATGLRRNEALALMLNDIDSSRMVIHVREGKGQKQRHVVLSRGARHSCTIRTSRAWCPAGGSRPTANGSPRESGSCFRCECSRSSFEGYAALSKGYCINAGVPTGSCMRRSHLRGRTKCSRISRYTHRIAISNHRLLKLDDGKVTFRWKDYRAGQRQKTMTLDADEFTRRFLLHVVPNGFVRIRHFGWMANRIRTEALEKCRIALDVPSAPEEAHGSGHKEGDSDWRQRLESLTGIDLRACPHCKVGRMIRTPWRPGWNDSS